MTSVRDHFLKNRETLTDGDQRTLHDDITEHRIFLVILCGLKHGLTRLNYISDRSLRSILFIDKLFIAIDAFVGYCVSNNADQNLGSECAQLLTEECHFILNFLNENVLSTNEPVLFTKEITLLEELNRLDVETGREGTHRDGEKFIAKAIILTNIKFLQRLKRINDPCLRICSFLERLLFLIESGTAFAETGLESKNCLPAIKESVCEVSELIQKEVDILIEYISTPHTSPDHPCGRKLMDSGKKSWESHLYDEKIK
jgi:hypothetical protein